MTVRQTVQTAAAIALAAVCLLGAGLQGFNEIPSSRVVSFPLGGYIETDRKRPTGRPVLMSTVSGPAVFVSFMPEGSGDCALILDVGPSVFILDANGAAAGERVYLRAILPAPIDLRELGASNVSSWTIFVMCVADNGPGAIFSKTYRATIPR